MKYAITILATAITILLMDIIWLKYIAGGFFTKHLETIGRFNADGTFNVELKAAALVYVTMIAAIIVFVVPRASNSLEAAMYGGLMGLVLYAVFDGTNLAILKDWSWNFAAVDIAWGTFLCAVTGLVAWNVFHYFSQ